MRHRLDGPRQMIEHQQCISEHPDAVRQPQTRARRRRHARLKCPHRFVREISDSAARESRQRKIRHLRRPVSGDQVRERHERIVVVRSRRMPAAAVSSVASPSRMVSTAIGSDPMNE